ncbi:MAG: ATP-binding cassette domain-containing protein [Caulobacteraceae bacterium]|nr:ATP-binding cassette domain-containing protein [Caulobacteraceae bacterium]
MSAPSPLHALVRAERRRQGLRLLVAGASAAVAAAGAVLLLGLSGWFLAGAALAGAAGPAAVLAFNYLLPSAGIRFLAIARTAGRYIERVASHEAALKALAEIRPVLFAGLAAGPPERSLALSSGEASGRLVQDVDVIETLFVRRSAPWAGAAAAIVGAALTALASPWAAAAFLTAFALQVALGVALGERMARAPGAEALAASGRLKDAVQAVAAASPELRCYGLTPTVIDALMESDQALGEARERRWAAEGLAGLAPAVLTGLAVAAVLALSAKAGGPLATLAALTAAAAMEGGSALARMFDDNGALDAAAGRLDEMLVPGAGGTASLAQPDAAAPITLRAGPLRADEASATLAPGERLALVGRSGAGKTRLLEMLVGLRAAEPGRLVIGGTPLEALPVGAARPLFAFAPQDAAMVAGSVRENLRLGDPDAPDEALWAALDDAGLAAKIHALPHGLDSWVGQGGERLSGGERRRLGLARALLRPAPWLLLDEPTEGLDGRTEAAVVEALERRLQRTGQGAVIVSHRQAPLALCGRRLEIP